MLDRDGHGVFACPLQNCFLLTFSLTLTIISIVTTRRTIVSELYFCIKKLNFCHKLKSSDPNFFATWWCKPMIFQTQIILSISINSLKYLRSTTLGYKDIGIRKSDFVAKTQLLYTILIINTNFNFQKKTIFNSISEPTLTEKPVWFGIYLFELASFKDCMQCYSKILFHHQFNLIITIYKAKL